jgi:hypothetical protein
LNRSKQAEEKRENQFFHFVCFIVNCIAQIVPNIYPLRKTPPPRYQQKNSCHSGSSPEWQELSFTADYQPILSHHLHIAA